MYACILPHCHPDFAMARSCAYFPTFIAYHYDMSKGTFLAWSTPKCANITQYQVEYFSECSNRQTMITNHNSLWLQPIDDSMDSTNSVSFRVRAIMEESSGTSYSEYSRFLVADTSQGKFIYYHKSG